MFSKNKFALGLLCAISLVSVGYLRAADPADPPKDKPGMFSDLGNSLKTFGGRKGTWIAAALGAVLYKVVTDHMKNTADGDDAAPAA